ncbi:hypothetical protein ABTX15_26780 [Micromonospora sp. NPDC094482]|uniref:hypothetical protein n=1 Tax=unclassified Micromonospora TaxID=2617518 RepID=UPI00332B1206
MIDREETLVRRLLADAAEDLPAGGMPTDALLAEGERAVRRRQRRAVGAAAVATVVAVLGAAVLLQGVRPQAQPTPGGGVSPSSTARQSATPSPAVTGSGQPPAVAPAGFDPTRRLFRMGWLPPGATHQTLETDRRLLSVSAEVPEGARVGDPWEPGPMMGIARSVTVRMGARGVDLFWNEREPAVFPGQTPSSVDLPGTPVAPIDGHPAFLYPSEDRMVLSWQYAPEGWISITVYRYDDPEMVARQVAAALIWETERVTVPFAPVGPPNGTTIGGTELRVYRGTWLDARVRYVASTAPGTGELRRDVALGVSNGIFAGDGSDAGGDRVVVAGRVGGATDGPKGFGVYRVAQMPGCPRCVAEVGSESEAGWTAIGGRSGALDLAASIRMVDGSDDLAAWRPL